jgi:hypothetical protein
MSWSQDVRIVLFGYTIESSERDRYFWNRAFVDVVVGTTY